MDWVVSIPDDGLETLISAILTTMGPKRNLRGHNRIVSENPNETSLVKWFEWLVFHIMVESQPFQPF